MKIGKILGTVENNEKILGVSLALTLVAFSLVSYVGVQQVEVAAETLLGGGSVKTDALWDEEVYNLTATADKSDLIITGKVVKVGNAEWSTPNGEKPANVSLEDKTGIHHHVMIDVNETIKGPKKKRIKLQVNTGDVGLYSHRLEDAPKYKEEETVLVYVQKWQGHYETLNQKYSKFNIGQEVITRDVPEEYGQKVNTSELLDKLRKRYEPRPSKSN